MKYKDVGIGEKKMKRVLYLIENHRQFHGKDGGKKWLEEAIFVEFYQGDTDFIGIFTDYDRN